MSEMIERVARAINPWAFDPENASKMKPEAQREARVTARAAIEAMRDLADNPGPNYTRGEYSRRNVEAMVDDALGRTAA